MTAHPFYISQAVTFLSALALVSALGMLFLRTIRLVIRCYGAQSVFLGTAAVLSGLGHGRSHALWMGIFAIIVKGGVIPWFLLKVAEDVKIKRETDPFIPFSLAAVAGVGLALISYAAVELVATGDSFAARGFGLALALMQLGLWLMVGRRKAITQTTGLLVVENGLFVAALSTSSAMPMAMELGLAFDLLVAVVVMGLLVFRIKTTFLSINTENLTRLKG